MKIIYLTTALAREDYKNLTHKHRLYPNPSNQNFHTKIIEALQSSYNVKVISSRPLHQKLLAKRDTKGVFQYPGFINVPLLKQVQFIVSGSLIANASKNDIVVVDVLNVTLLRLAKTIKRNSNVRVIGIVTDNPINLSRTSKRYSEAVFKGTNICDAFITLTDGLDRLFNPKLKPVMTVIGVVEPVSSIKLQDEHYAFFSGALYERYGVTNLIKAFSAKNVPYKLKIAGHGPLSDALKKDEHDNIEFLGTITPDEAREYQTNAAVNINPRPAEESIDRFSIPSKVIDYIATGRVTLSTENEHIRDIVDDNIVWLKDNNPESILEALFLIKNNYQQYATKALIAKDIIEATLGPKQFNKKFAQLLLKLK